MLDTQGTAHGRASLALRYLVHVNEITMNDVQGAVNYLQQQAGTTELVAWDHHPNPAGDAFATVLGNVDAVQVLEELLLQGAVDEYEALDALATADYAVHIEKDSTGATHYVVTGYDGPGGQALPPITKVPMGNMLSVLGGLKPQPGDGLPSDEELADLGIEDD